MRKTINLGHATESQISDFLNAGIYPSVSQLVAVAIDRHHVAHFGHADASPGDITHYNQVVLAAPAACVECGCPLSVDSAAYQPVTRDGPLPEFYCPECWAA